MHEEIEITVNLSHYTAGVHFKENVHLFSVTHCIFSKGIESLQQTQIYNPYILQSGGVNL